MTTISTIATWRPRDGKTSEFLASAATAKKIHERLGAKVRLYSSTFGGQPTTLSYVLEHASWGALGAFGEKVEKDNEWQVFWAKANANPTADLVQNNVVSELHI
ncbi:MAG TPA: hypothetical protein VGS12_05390 [Caulobacteraceae bacterium]|nr:hypothetical protein [Caulobacteraceae bacterium]